MQAKHVKQLMESACVKGIALCQELRGEIASAWCRWQGRDGWIRKVHGGGLLEARPSVRAAREETESEGGMGESCLVVSGKGNLTALTDSNQIPFYLYRFHRTDK